MKTDNATSARRARQLLPTPSYLFTVPQAAAHLGISTAKTWELVSAGQIRSLKIASSRRIRPEDLAAYVESLLTSAPTPLDAA